MSISMRDLDPAFKGAGQKAGLEIWRIENFNPVPIPQSSYGKFFTGDSYVILKTTASKSGALRHDIHYWLGKDTSQDEAGAAAIKTVELDASLGGRAVQYREVQGHETEKFLSYFKPCIIPQEGGAASGFKHVEAEEHKTRLFVCKGKHVVHVKEAKDGKLMADSESGEFWGCFGGFAPLPRRTVSDDDKPADSHPPKLLCVDKGKAEPIETDSLTKEFLDTNKCYILDCGLEVFAWMGRNTSLDERKSASVAADELIRGTGRPKSHIIRVIEGFETVMFKSKFDSWPQASDAPMSEEGRGKVAALLKRQGLDVKGLVKSEPKQEEPQPHIDCTGHLQVWRVNGQEKILLPATDQSKFYNGDCYIFQYSYPGEDKEEHLIGTWIGKTSVEEERASALSLASKMVESMKFLPSQGGLSDGYKNYIAEKEIPDETYNEDGVALFRIQGTGPDNMQAIQVEPVASSLNSTYCYILHSGPTVFIWSGGLATSDDQELVERMLDLIKVKEIHNFSQDDLMTEDIYILDCHSEVFVWVGQQVDSKNRMQALTIGEKFLEHDFLLEALSREAPIYIVKEGSEPPFFTRFFKWESAKSAMLGNSFQRKLAIVKNGGMPLIVKHKRRASATFGGRSSGAPDKSQRSRSMSVSPDRVRVRGRSPAFNALAANFESSNARNLSTPPPMIRKLYPKSVAKDTAQLVPKSSAIAHLTSSFEPFSALENLIPQSQKANSVTPKSNPETSDKEGSMSSRIESLTIQEDVKEGEAEDDEGLPVYPYERVNTASTDPVEDIDVTKREAPSSASSSSYELSKGINGLDKVILRDARGSSAEVYLYGAHVTSWKNDHAEELLFLSSKFSNLGPLDSHGFARNQFWTIDDSPPPFPTSTSNKAFVDLILKPSEDDIKIWPHSEVRVEGLETLDYLDNLQKRERFTEQGDALTFESEFDRIYLSTPTKIAILDHEKKRTIVLRKDGLPDAVVWNPWDKKAKAISDFGDDEYKYMLCVEAAAIEKPITLKPGEEWKGRLELSTVSSSYCSGQLDPKRVIQGS
ncbi:hypothetical protein JHK86_046619 [Glycine max]|nr:hypothetical protein JHK86_046619 [Glycine max]